MVPLARVCALALCLALFLLCLVCYEWCTCSFSRIQRWSLSSPLCCAELPHTLKKVLSSHMKFPRWATEMKVKGVHHQVRVVLCGIGWLNTKMAPFSGHNWGAVVIFLCACVCRKDGMTYLSHHSQENVWLQDDFSFHLRCRQGGSICASYVFFPLLLFLAHKQGKSV